MALDETALGCGALRLESAARAIRRHIGHVALAPVQLLAHERATNSGSCPCPTRRRVRAARPIITSGAPTSAATLSEALSLAKHRSPRSSRNRSSETSNVVPLPDQSSLGFAAAAAAYMKAGGDRKLSRAADCPFQKFTLDLESTNTRLIPPPLPSIRTRRQLPATGRSTPRSQPC